MTPDPSIRQARIDRDYDELVRLISSSIDEAVDPMSHLVELAWSQLQSSSVSWLGFYHLDEQTGHRQMLLGPHMDRPACSPIGMNGACGRALEDQRTILIEDMAQIDPDQVIPCDPRDRSEIVIPCKSPEGLLCVLDLDSHEASAFSLQDDLGLRDCLVAAGFCLLEPSKT
ncbi:MAG: hypothetical protein CMJ32_07780 [Phycisphaerae bacterium]|nr:hypothetical protein [Phycisphaerae bacterium]